MKKQLLTVTGILFCISFLMMSQTKPVQNTLKASVERGKKVYTERCLTCHQADGGGVQNMNPPLIKTKWVLGDKTQLITIVLKGLNTGVVIDDIEYHNVMASHADLTDLQIADVLTYVRNSFGNKAKAITSAEVKAVRAKLK
ncbi:MAG: cytochrome c [Bacteroidetes bacterium]|nr:cytochrome c [Bacteroidota bacterium]